MLKQLNRLWLSSLRKAGKAQQARTTKLFKAMLTIPKPSKAGKSPGTSTPRKPAAAPSGEWRSAYCNSDTVPTRRMRYRLYLPTDAAPVVGRPLLIMLHGCEQNAADFAAGTRMNRLAGERGYVVLYPEQSLQAHAHRCWKWYDPTTQRGGGDIALIAHMVRKVVDEQAIDRRRIYVCGISAGAAMAHILALTHPELIAAVGMHSGPVFGVSRSAMGAYGVMQRGSANAAAAIAKVLIKNPAFPGMPAILITGDDDKIVRPVNQVQLVGQFIHLNHARALTPLPPVVKQFGRTSKAQPRKNSMQVRDFIAGTSVLIRSIHIERLGHAWSGGDDKLPFHAKGPDAGKLMLAFFSRHRRRS